MSKNAFTLIELLIVVAIIAILAAIAVPNFLEAQTRSKVSRVKADMRTVMTALESYRVDNNAYPIPDRASDRSLVWDGSSNVLGAWWMDVHWGEPGDTWYSPPLLRDGNGFWLTSPVAYLTTIPEDPFTTDLLLKQATSIWGAPIFSASFLYSSVINGVAQYPLTGPNPVYKDVGYSLISVGPDLTLDYVPYYDPSNGTLSKGDLIGLGKGYSFAERIVR